MKERERLMALVGVYSAKKNNGELYYRSSITYNNKHISLGSYPTERLANKAYMQANRILYIQKKKNIEPHYDDYQKSKQVMSYDKWIMLWNLKDNGIYCRNPIYLRKNFFLYYLSEEQTLKFDIDDLFYYTKHRIMKRGGHLFVADYGMQVNIMSRYGIKNFAVIDRDYRFVNGDRNDLRYHNIQIINRYYGVQVQIRKGQKQYISKIHINGDYIIGRYSTDTEAAIAYNKAVILLKQQGFNKNFPENYIDTMDDITYAKIYNSIKISRKLREFVEIR